MITFELCAGFRRAYRKRIGNNSTLHKRIGKRIELFRRNRAFPLLHDHALKGTKEGLRSFSVTGDIRIIYYIYDNIAYFVDIGTHNQVY
jgi:mRNA-degrading endonuclease YafQ of YafQ-DinJ toxin-antitoxin module